MKSLILANPRKSKRPAVGAKSKRPAFTIFRNPAGVMSRPFGSSKARRKSRRSSGGGLFGDIFTKDNAMIAAGAVSAPLTAGLVTRFAGSFLPGYTSPFVGTAYRAGIPIIVGALTRKVSPSFSKGLIVGGFALGIAELMDNFLPGATAGQTPVQSTGAYLNGAGSGAPPINLADKAFRPVGAMPSILGNSPAAFKRNAW